MPPAVTDPQRPDTWRRYRPGLCADCNAGCCRLPVELRFDDLVRLGLADAFEREDPLKALARRLMKAGVIAHFNGRDGLFTLTQHSSGDCLYLDRDTRRCTVYERRPDTCRQHPQIGPRPGFCAYRPRD